MEYDPTESWMHADIRTPTMVRWLDAFFILILYASNFNHALINTETGTGRYVPIMAIAFGVMSLPFYRYYYAKWNRATMLLAGFFGVAAISDVLYLWGYNMEVFVRQRQLMMSMFYLIVAYNMMRRDARYIRILLYVIIFSAVINGALIALGWSVAESHERGVDGLRTSVLGQNANATSRSLAVALIYVFIMAMGLIRNSKLVRLMLLGAAPFMFIGMLKLGSRGGLLALAVSIPVVMLTARSQGKRMLISVALALGFIAAVALVMQSEMILSRLEQTFYDRDTGGREGIFYGCLATWQTSIWLGHGLAMHGLELAAATGNLSALANGFLATHCTYTFVLCSGGLIGFSLYMLFLWNIWTKAWKIRYFQLGNFCFAAFVLSLFCALTQNIEYSFWPSLVYAAVLAVFEQAEEDGVPNQNEDLIMPEEELP